jgi:hypothetical protein
MLQDGQKPATLSHDTPTIPVLDFNEAEEL